MSAMTGLKRRNALAPAAYSGGSDAPTPVAGLAAPAYHDPTTGLGRRLRYSGLKFDADFATTGGLFQQMLGQQDDAMASYERADTLMERAQQLGPEVQDVQQAIDAFKNEGVLSGLQKSGEYLATEAINMLPGMAMSVGGALAGGAVGTAVGGPGAGTLAGAGAGLAARTLGKKAAVKLARDRLSPTAVAQQGRKKALRAELANLSEEQAKTEAGKAILAQGGANAGRTLGQFAGAAPGVMVPITGGSREELQQTDQEGALKIGAANLAASALGSVATLRYLNQATGGLATQAVSQQALPYLQRVKNAVKRSAVTGQIEGLTEVGQEVIQTLGHKWVNDNIDVLSSENLQNYLLSYAVGSVLGTGFGGAIETAGGTVNLVREQAGPAYNAVMEPIRERMRTAAATRAGQLRQRMRPGERMTPEAGSPTEQRFEDNVTRMSIDDDVEAQTEALHNTINDLVNATTAQGNPLIGAQTAEQFQRSNPFMRFVPQGSSIRDRIAMGFLSNADPSLASNVALVQDVMRAFNTLLGETKKTKNALTEPEAISIIQRLGDDPDSGVTRAQADQWIAITAHPGVREAITGIEKAPKRVAELDSTPHAEVEAQQREVAAMHEGGGGVDITPDATRVASEEDTSAAALAMQGTEGEKPPLQLEPRDLIRESEAQYSGDKSEKALVAFFDGNREGFLDAGMLAARHRAVNRQSEQISLKESLIDALATLMDRGVKLDFDVDKMKGGVVTYKGEQAKLTPADLASLQQRPINEPRSPQAERLLAQRAKERDAKAAELTAKQQEANAEAQAKRAGFADPIERVREASKPKLKLERELTLEQAKAAMRERYPNRRQVAIDSAAAAYMEGENKARRERNARKQEQLQQYLETEGGQRELQKAVDAMYYGSQGGGTGARSDGLKSLQKMADDLAGSKDKADRRKAKSLYRAITAAVREDQSRQEDAARKEETGDRRDFEQGPRTAPPMARYAKELEGTVSDVQLGSRLSDAVNQLDFSWKAFEYLTQLADAAGVDIGQIGRVVVSKNGDKLGVELADGKRIMLDAPKDMDPMYIDRVNANVTFDGMINARENMERYNPAYHDVLMPMLPREFTQARRQAWEQHKKNAARRKLSEADSLAEWRKADKILRGRFGSELSAAKLMYDRIMSRIAKNTHERRHTRVDAGRTIGTQVILRETQSPQRARALIERLAANDELALKYFQRAKDGEFDNTSFRELPWDDDRVDRNPKEDHASYKGYLEPKVFDNASRLKQLVLQRLEQEKRRTKFGSEEGKALFKAIKQLEDIDTTRDVNDVLALLDHIPAEYDVKLLRLSTKKGKGTPREQAETQALGTELAYAKRMMFYLSQYADLTEPDSKVNRALDDFFGIRFDNDHVADYAGQPRKRELPLAHRTRAEYNAAEKQKTIKARDKTAPLAAFTALVDTKADAARPFSDPNPADTARRDDRPESGLAPVVRIADERRVLAPEPERKPVMDSVTKNRLEQREQTKNDLGSVRGTPPEPRRPEVPKAKLVKPETRMSPDDNLADQASKTNPELDREASMINELLGKFGLKSKIKLTDKPWEGVTVNAGGAQRGDTIYIHPRLKGEARVETLMHEVGHFLIENEYESAPADVKAAIQSAYETWAKANGKRRTQFAIRKTVAPYFLNKRAGDKSKVKKSPKADIETALSMHEWMADQIARALTSDKRATTVIGKFFEGLAAKFRQLYDAVFAGKRSPKWLPDPSVQAFVDHLFNRDTAAVQATTGTALPADVAQGITTNTPQGIIDTIKYLMHRETREMLYRVVSSGRVTKAVLKHFADDKAAIKRWNSAGEQVENRIAMAYDAWRAGALNVGPEAHAAFVDQSDLLLLNAGIASEGMLTGVVFEDMLTNRVNEIKQQGVTYNIRDLAAGSLGKRMRSYNKAVRMLDKVSDTWSKVLSSKMERMRRSGIPALVKAASAMQKHTGDIGEDRGAYTDTRNRTAVMANLFGNALDKVDEAQRLEALQYLQRMPDDATELSALSEPAQELVKDMRKIMSMMRTYLKKSGVLENDQARDSFWPVIFEADAPADKIERLRTLLSDPSMQPHVRKFFNDEKGEIEYSELLDNLVKRAYHLYDDADFKAPDDLDPAFRGANRRSMQFIFDHGSPELKAEFAALQTKTFNDVFNGYIIPAVRNAEFTERFGGGENNRGKLDAMITEARKQGATDSQIAELEAMVEAFTGTYGADGSPVLKLIAPKLNDRLKGRGTQRVLGTIMAYQNLRVLPLALLASLVDPMGISVRTGGDFNTSIEGVRKGLASIVSKTPKAEVQDMLDRLMMADDMIVWETLNGMYGGTDSNFSKSLNEFVFKWNGLSWWTQQSRNMAMVAAHGFLLKHAARPDDATSIRYLAELEVEPSDIVADGKHVKLLSLGERNALGTERKSATTERKAEIDAELARDAKVRHAIIQFIDESILRPNPQQTPQWFSDPYVGVLTQYKAFIYAMYDQIVRRIGHEMKLGNPMVLMAALMYFPITLFAELLREGVQYLGQGNPNRADWGLAEWSMHTATRTGLLGPQAEVATTAVEDLNRGSLPGTSLGGPTTSQFGDIIGALRGHRDAGKTFEAALPASSLWRQYNNLGTGEN